MIHKNNFYSQQGYVALMSAIVISVLLIAVTASLGFSAFFGRFNIVDSESKERSLALAEACVSHAILEVGAGTFSNDKTVAIGDEECKIASAIASPSGPVIIKTQAEVNKAYSNIQAVINSETLDVISWDEVAN